MGVTLLPVVLVIKIWIGQICNKTRDARLLSFQRSLRGRCRLVPFHSFFPSMSCLKRTVSAVVEQARTCTDG